MKDSTGERHRPSHLLSSVALLLAAMAAPQQAAAQVRRAPDRSALETALLQAAATDEHSRTRRRKIDTALERIAIERARHARSGSVRPYLAVGPGLRVDPSTGILVDAVATGSPLALRARLESMGLRHARVYGRHVAGFLPPARIAELDGIDELRFARVALSRRATGSTTSQGDLSTGARILREARVLSGAGVVVGVMSDSFDCLGGAAGDVSSGDLPGQVTVLRDATEFGCPGALDEGRAMLQIVRDLAPGASLAFHTAGGGVADFAAGIGRLRTEAGARIIVDDVLYLSEPMFQDGVIAQAVDAAARQGVAYFSAAGNAALQSYESPFRRSARPGYLPGSERHDFDPGPGTDDLQDFAIAVGQTVYIVLQWNEPFFSVSGPPGAASNVDLILYSATGTPVAGSAQDNSGGDALEIIAFQNPGPATAFRLGIEHRGGPRPSLMKVVWFGALNPTEYTAPSSTIYGHANADGAATVGAAFHGSTPAAGVSPPLRQYFSSAGGTAILFDSAGAVVNLRRNKPEIVGVDGVDNTVLGNDSDGNGRPNFFGTSAAAPHVAAIAALLLQQEPTASRPQLLAALIDSAIDMDVPGTDQLTGAGLVSATAASERIQYAASASVAGFSALADGRLAGPTIPFTAYSVSGLTVSASNAIDGALSTTGVVAAGGTAFNGAALSADGPPGGATITFDFSPDVDLVSWSYATNSGQLQVDVLDSSGQVLRTVTINNSVEVAFADGITLRGGAVSIEHSAPFSALRLRSTGGDTRLRVDDVRWSLRASTAPNTADAPLPLWSLAALAACLMVVGARASARVRVA